MNYNTRRPLTTFIYTGIFTLVLAFFMEEQVFGFQRVIEIPNENFESIPLFQYVDIVQDESFSLDDIVSDAVKYEKMSSRRLMIKDKAYWVKFSLNNTAGSEIQTTLIHTFPSTPKLQVWNVTGNRRDAFPAIGNYYPSGERQVKYRYPSIPLNLAPGLNTFVVKVDNASESVSLDFVLMNTSSFHEEKLLDSTLIAFLVGIMIFAIVYNLFVLTQLRSMQYVYYIAYCICIGGCFLSLIGILPFYLFPKSTNPLASGFVTLLLSNLTNTFSTLFTIHFLKASSTIPSLAKVLKLWVVVFLVGTAVTIAEFAIGAFKFSPFFALTMAALYSPFLLISGLVCAFRGYKPAKFYLIAWSSLVFLALRLNLVFLGKVDFSDRYDLWGLAGAASEVCLLSLALGNKVKTESDELHAQLKVHNERLDELVEEKTKKIKYILNTVSLAIFKVNRDLKIDPEYSKASLDIFKRDEIKGLTLSELLFKDKDVIAEQDHVTISTMEMIIGEDSFNYEANSESLSREIHVAGKVLLLDWMPIINNYSVEGFLITAKDVTYEKSLEDENRRSLEEVKFLKRTVEFGRDRIVQYIEDEGKTIKKTRKLINALLSHEAGIYDENLFVALRNLHTIKGNARTFGLYEASNLVHKCENEIKDQSLDFICTTINTYLSDLDKMFVDYLSIIEKYVPTPTKSEKNEMEKFVNYIGTLYDAERFAPESLKTSIADIRKYFKGYALSDLKGVVEPMENDIPRIAQRLGKATPRIVVEEPGCYLKIEHLYAVRSIFTHLIRNSIDHGIEQSDERLAKMKPAEGSIYIEVTKGDNEYAVLFFDDGRGLQLKAVYEKALSKGILQPEKRLTYIEVAKLIFTQGLSSKTEVTEISGRGVGLDAVKEDLAALGGDIAIILDTPALAAKAFDPSEAEEFIPFRFRISLPLAAFMEPRVMLKNAS